MSASHTQPGILAPTKAKMFIFASLVFTWWVAHFLPHFEPIIRQQISGQLQKARQKIPSIKVDWAIPADPPAAFNSSKIALLIEPRPLPHLVPLIMHMVTVVPPDWRFVFIGSEKSVFSVSRANALQNQQVIGKLDLMVLPEPWDISSKEMVFRSLTDMRFYDEFLPEAEWILKYESDSILCGNSPKSLNEWLEWSWAGAPRNADDRFSGNGGLSLRKVSAIRRVLSFQARYNNSEPEDEWFGRRLWVLPGEKVASGLTALAVENVYVEKPMGFHIADGGKNLPDAVWMDPDQRKDIFSYCPELSLIMDMKLERERCEGDDKMGNIRPSPEEIAAKEAARNAALSSASVASVKSVKSAASAASVASAKSAKIAASATGVAKAGDAKATDAPAPAKAEAASTASASPEATPLLD